MSTLNRRAFSANLYHGGFTLIEMIVVITITAIVGAVVAVFIRTPVQGYVDMVARAELADEADTIVRRMSRDLRLALPNSIRITTSNGNTYLELLLTATGGRYLTEEDDVAGGNTLDFSNAADTSFDVVGDLSADPRQSIRTGNQVVIYNLGQGQAPADAYCNGTACNNRAQVTAVNASARTITMAGNPFATQMPSMRSPSHRFQIVTTPVTYEYQSGARTLTRYSGYTIQAAQPTPPAGGGMVTGLLANGVTNCLFNYDTLANVRNALVGITLTLQRPNTNSGAITLFHQVHVDNTP